MGQGEIQRQQLWGLLGWLRGGGSVRCRRRNSRHDFNEYILLIISPSSFIGFNHSRERGKNTSDKFKKTRLLIICVQLISNAVDQRHQSKKIAVNK